MTNETDYQKQANDFLKATNTEFKAEFLEHSKHFPDDKESRDIYKITLKRGNRKYSFNFGQSINNSGFYYTKGKQKIDIDRKYLDKEVLKKYGISLAGHIKKNGYSFLNNGKSDVIHYPKTPTAYDVLTCLTKTDPGTFDNFCAEYGYDEDSRKAYKIYKSVMREWSNVAILYNDSEIKQLQEIN